MRHLPLAVTATAAVTMLGLPPAHTAADPPGPAGSCAAITRAVGIHYQAAVVLGRAAAAERADPLRLTQREREVLGLVCAGRSNAEIAAQLFISVKTAGHHVSAILAKLDAPTRHAAAIRAAEIGLTGVPADR